MKPWFKIRIGRGEMTPARYEADVDLEKEIKMGSKVFVAHKQEWRKWRSVATEMVECRFKAVFIGSQDKMCILHHILRNTTVL